MTELTKTQKTTLTKAFELQTFTTAELATALDISESAARKRLRALEGKGLVECERSEGTAGNGSSALVSLCWTVDTDDDDTRAALGMEPLTFEDDEPETPEVAREPSDEWMLVADLQERSDGYLKALVQDPADAGYWNVIVRPELDLRPGLLVKVELDGEGLPAIVDVKRPEPKPVRLWDTGAEYNPAMCDDCAPSDAEPVDGAGPGARCEGCGVEQPRERDTVAPAARSLSITVTARRRRRVVLTLGDLRPETAPVEPELVLTTEQLAPAPAPAAVATAGESTVPVDTNATAKLSPQEIEDEVRWINAVCAEACALVGLDWYRIGIMVQMNTRFTRRLGDARQHGSMSWILPQGRIRFSASALWRRASKEERFNTVIHELAHVLAPCKHGRKVQSHGREWKAMHRELGAEPRRTHSINRQGLRRRRRRFRRERVMATAQGLSAEQRFELEAAFGRGVTVVNLVTGERHRT